MRMMFWQAIYGEKVMKIVLRPGKMGLGTAYMDGLRVITGTHVILMDADMSHHPRYVCRLHGDISGDLRVKENTTQRDVFHQNRMTKARCTKRHPRVRIAELSATICAQIPKTGARYSFHDGLLPSSSRRRCYGVNSLYVMTR